MTLSRPKNLPDKLESFVGEPIVLEIEASRPTAEVKWLLNGKDIEPSSNITITEDGVFRRLTINCPTTKYSGKYTCDATDDTMDFQVKVSGEKQELTLVWGGEIVLDLCVSSSTEPPVKIVRKSEIEMDLKFLVSDDIVLECEISQANGIAKWYKDGYRVQGDERFFEEEEGAFRSLVIVNAELKDSGEYFLDVEDDSISFHVKVEGKIQTVTFS